MFLLTNEAEHLFIYIIKHSSLFCEVSVQTFWPYFGLSAFLSLICGVLYIFQILAFLGWLYES